MDETMVDMQIDEGMLTTNQPRFKFDTKNTNDVLWSNEDNLNSVAVEDLFPSLQPAHSPDDLSQLWDTEYAIQYESICVEPDEEDILNYLNYFRNSNGFYRQALDSTDNLEMQLFLQQQQHPQKEDKSISPVPNSPQSTFWNPSLLQMEPYSPLPMWNEGKVNDKQSTMPNSPPLTQRNPLWSHMGTLSSLHIMSNEGKVKDKFSESLDHTVTCTDQCTDLKKSILNNYSVVSEFDDTSCDTDMTVLPNIKEDEEQTGNHRTRLSPHIQIDINKASVATVANDRTDDMKMEDMKEFIDKDGDTLLHIFLAKHYDNPNIASWLRTNEALFKPFVNISNKERQTPLHIAVFLQNVELVSVLIDFGADLVVFDSYLSSPIHVALEKTVTGMRQNLPVRKAMLEVMLKKTHPSIIAKVIDSLNKNGLAAIHLASDVRDLEIMKILIKYGADINKQEGKSGYTSLMKVIKSAAAETDSRNSSVCFKLAKSIITQLRPNVNICSYSNDSPLHLACACNNRDLVVTLLNENARVNKKNLDRKSEKDLTSDLDIKNVLEVRIRKKRRSQKKEACEA